MMLVCPREDLLECERRERLDVAHAPTVFEQLG
jgi:hypothetical protein